MMTTKNRIVAIEGGPDAYIHTYLLRTAAAFTRPFHFRGMQRCAGLLNSCFTRESRAVVKLASGGTLSISLGDAYWTNLVIPDFLYEPEIGFVLLRALQQDHAVFIDCGANIGHWSAIAGAVMRKPGNVIAIEASPPCFDHLAENALLNDGLYQCILGAVWSCDGEDLTIVTHDKRHAGSSVVNRRDKRGHAGYREYAVGSVTLESVYRDYVAEPDARLVIKLDVEGAEIPALEGAGAILHEKETLIIYEDHFADVDCPVSEYVLDTLGHEVYYCTGKCGIVRMKSLPDIRRMKSQQTSHNFFACSSGSVFARMLREMSADSPAGVLGRAASQSVTSVPHQQELPADRTRGTIP
jgi:FkbM family methyltransferase